MYRGTQEELLIPRTSMTHVLISIIQKWPKLLWYPTEKSYSSTRWDANNFTWHHKTHEVHDFKWYILVTQVNRKISFTAATSSYNCHTFSCRYSERDAIKNLPFWHIPGRNQISELLINIAWNEIVLQPIVHSRSDLHKCTHSLGWFLNNILDQFVLFRVHPNMHGTGYLEFS